MKIIEIVGLILIIVELYVLYKLFKSPGDLTPRVKWFAFFGIIALPVMFMFAGNYHVFETSKTVEACMGCHVMKPMANDMMNTESQSLAARHMKNGWIREKQCYGCHKDYGLNGTLKAKVDGYRHLMRYVTETYQEPITYRGEFNSMNCMGCHAGKPAFEQHKVHQPVTANLNSDNPTISCSNCHGRAHPTRLQRTPGHPDYDGLMSSSEPLNYDLEENTEEIKDWLAKF